MKVALVLTEVGAEAGGRFTFQEMLASAVERLRDDTPHQFLTFSAGLNRHAHKGVGWWSKHLLEAAVTGAVRTSRDLQDTIGGRRLFQLRSPLQRRLDAAWIDLVWFPTTHVEDVDLPYICTVFDLEHRNKPWFPESTARGEFERRERVFNRYLPKATRVIVPNKTGRSQVMRYYRVPPQHCLVLPHPTPDFALAAADRPRQSDDVVRAHGISTPYLLYPAQLWPHKNHAAALDALTELHRRGERFALALVGRDGGQLSHIRRQVSERGLDSFVHFLGFVAANELIALYQHAYALLYLSRFGPENLPPLEAFALGCPVIVADIPGARDQVGNAALVVDASKSMVVADAVKRIGADVERTRLVAEGKRRARAWTTADYVRRVVDFVDEFEQERRLWP